MTRYLLTGFILSVALVAEAAQPPMAMPGNAGPQVIKPQQPTMPPPVATPATTAQPTPQNMPMDGEVACEGESCCPTRQGLLRRLFAGRRPACAAPQACGATGCYGEDNCVWQPIYTIYDSSGRMRRGSRRDCGRERTYRDRCRRFFIGLFRCRDRCRPERCRFVLGRVKGWFCWAQCRMETPHCAATPYHTPVRYYFSGETEPCVGNCRPNCQGQPCAAGGGGINGAVQVLGGGGLGLGIGARIRGEVIGDGAGRGGLCKQREQCYDLPGSHFRGNLRFAKIDKPDAPPVEAGKPLDYQGYWNYEGFPLKSKPGDGIQQVSHAESPKK